MNVPFIDFSEQYNAVKDEIFTGQEGVFKKGKFILGQPEKDFEQDFAFYSYTVFCSEVRRRILSKIMFSPAGKRFRTCYGLLLPTNSRYRC